MIGKEIGHYRIDAEIGKGGMGVVYRAHDTQLRRDVALKVLPQQFSTDADRLERFQREAQVLASLNHPNIAHIYGLERATGTGCIVMELVEGETLEDRVGRGPIPDAEAIQIVRHIIDALEAAHERGIIHRDLKPANIKISPDGIVKVLDFGLAKAIEPSPAGEGPTRVSGSIPGMVMGTAAYMSPEQARGKVVDTRTDIWAFGCVLFEMLSAKPAFDGETVTDIIAKIVQSEPQWNLLPIDLPSSVRTLLEATLRKDLKQRLQHIADARLFLNQSAFQAAPTPVVARPKRATWILRTVALIAFIAALVPATLYFVRPPSDEAPEIRFQIPAPGILSESLSVSPDGQYIAYVALVNDTRSIWVRPVGSVTAQALRGTERAANSLFWSPDSRWIAFYSGGLKKIPLSGGTPTLLADTSVSGPGAWNSNGDILFEKALGTGPQIVRVSDSGGPVTPITTRNSSAVSRSYNPIFLPDGRRFWFFDLQTASQQSLIEIVQHAASLDSKSVTKLKTIGTIANLGALTSPIAYVPPGILLTLFDGSLYAQPMNTDGKSLRTDPVRLAENVAGFSASPRLLVYRQGIPGGFDIASAVNQLMWFDRSGKQTSAAGDPGDYVSVDISPDDRRAILTKAAPLREALDIWVTDLNRGNQDRLTSKIGVDFAPVWSPDGREIIFGSQDNLTITQPPKLYRRSSISVGSDKLLLDDGPTAAIPQDWSSDDKYLVFIRRLSADAAAQNLWYIAPSGEGKPTPYLESQSVKAEAQISPDGRWLAYATNESGTFQIVVQSFPDPKISKTVVTTNGGREPRWRKDGRELFYLAPDKKLMAVSVKIGDTFEAGAETTLFQTPITGLPLGTGGLFNYDVTSDGKRFLIVAPVATSAKTSPSPADSIPITAVVNWATALKK